jgi:predicted Rossmann-fold nucleotide-binding protein
MEMLTLAQTHKLQNKIAIVLYGSAYWNEVVNFDALVRHGMINPRDLELFRFADDPKSALEVLQTQLALEEEEATPAFAKSRTPRPRRP